MTAYTEHLAGFAAGLRFDDLPLDVVEQAKLVFMDAVGCALAAYREEPRKAAVAVETAGDFGARPTSTIIGAGATHAALAAFANGFLVNAADNDDTHKAALTHTGSVVVPAALAVAEAQDSDGRALIEALVAGYEITVRIGMAVMPAHYRYWHSTATNGTFGAAAAAAKAYGLSAAQIRAALGFAGTQAAGLNTFFESGDDTKSLHPGKAGLNGVLSAILAARGSTSPPEVIGHPKGYLAAFSAEPKPDRVLAGLGTQWEILNNGYKLYPSILASHSPIGAMLDIVSRDPVAPEEVAAVTVRTYDTVKSHFSNKNVSSPMSARLSVPYCVAAALVDRIITQAQFKGDRICDPVIQDVLKKVEIVAESELTALYPEKFPASVVVRLNDGRTREATFLYPKGDPKNPLSPAELEDKFRYNAEGVIAPGTADAFLHALKRLQFMRVRDVTALLKAKGMS